MPKDFTTYVSEGFFDWEFRCKAAYGKEIQDMNLVSLQNWDKYPEVTETDKDFLKYIVENAYWDTSLDAIYAIISEDTGAYWAGDKTVEETAEIIQSRISLYLEEL